MSIGRKRNAVSTGSGSLARATCWAAAKRRSLPFLIRKDKYASGRSGETLPCLRLRWLRPPEVLRHWDLLLLRPARRVPQSREVAAARSALRSSSAPASRRVSFLLAAASSRSCRHRASAASWARRCPAPPAVEQQGPPRRGLRRGLDLSQPEPEECPRWPRSSGNFRDVVPRRRSSRSPRFLASRYHWLTSAL